MDHSSDHQTETDRQTHRHTDMHARTDAHTPCYVCNKATSLHCMHAMRPKNSVVCVCLLCPTKTVELIEMPFGCCIRRGPDPQERGTAEAVILKHAQTFLQSTFSTLFARRQLQCGVWLLVLQQLVSLGDNSPFSSAFCHVHYGISSIPPFQHFSNLRSDADNNFHLLSTYI